MFRICKSEGLEDDPRLFELLQLQMCQSKIEPSLNAILSIWIALDESLELLACEVIHPIVVEVDCELKVRVLLGILGEHGGVK